MENVRAQISFLLALKRSRNKAEKILKFYKRVEEIMSTRLLGGLKRRGDEVEKKLDLFVELEEKMSTAMEEIREELASGTPSEERRRSRRRIYDQLARNLPCVKNVKLKLESYCTLIRDVEHCLDAETQSSSRATMVD